MTNEANNIVTLLAEKQRIEEEISRVRRDSIRDLIAGWVKTADEISRGLGESVKVYVEVNGEFLTEPPLIKRKVRGAGDAGTNRAQGPVLAKYVHPDDSSKTWTGRGRHPAWVAEFLSQGGNFESLLINKNQPEQASEAESEPEADAAAEDEAAQKPVTPKVVAPSIRLPATPVEPEDESQETEDPEEAPREVPESHKIPWG